MTRNVHWTLRIGAAACFIGHGAFGIITKEAWVPYFAVARIPRDLAYTLMPVVGTIDVAAGVAVLLSVRPAVLAYMAVWAFWTALLRPLTGDSLFETLERAGNFGVPLALLLLVGLPRRLRDWFRPASDTIAGDLAPVMLVLRGTSAMLVFGHGALAVLGTPILVSHVTLAGLPAQSLSVIGYAEMSVAVLLLAWPSATLLIAVAAWKIATESLWIASGAPVWEFIERGGSYAAPIALALLLLRHPFATLTLKRTS